ncbi:phage tail sheath family protein [Pyxidicoccus sp. 3LFB2]
MQQVNVPGVYISQEWREPRPPPSTGVPALLGYVEGHKALPAPRRLTHPAQLDTEFAGLKPDAALAAAVRGFFENGGQQCQVVPLGEAQTLKAGLEALLNEDAIDLVCAPCLPPLDAQEGLPRAQVRLLEFCARRGDCFALLDSPQPGTSVKAAEESVLEARKLLAQRAPDSSLGAIYYPWIRVAGTPDFIPPCGHIAGLFARVDRKYGFGKAPANEVLAGALELAGTLLEPGQLNDAGINALRALPGRGIRVMGARTLSDVAAWRSISVRRLFLALRRRLMRELAWVAFEPNDLRLWLRLQREVGVILEDLFQRGALKGSTPEEAFYVKCDAENNPPAVREQGGVIVEVGLAPATPREFLVLRLVQREGKQIEIAAP